jgi:acyl-CoA thioesterase FadM
LLTVSELQVRYRRGAEYDDLIRIRCWVREVATRRVTFGYVVEHAGRGETLATGMTSLIAVNRDFGVVHLPADVKDALCSIPDPVRI